MTSDWLTSGASARLCATPLFGRVLIAVAAIAVSTASAYAQTSYTGQEYSSGTTPSTIYAAYSSLTQDSTVNFSSTQTSASGTRTLASNGWFEYNVSGVTDGTFDNPGGGYPTGYEFNGSMVESGTGAAGAASVTFTGQVKASGGATSYSSWVKGPTESGGDWNVRSSQSSFLGGYTNGSNTGTSTLLLGAEYTSFATLIGTNTGATLNVQIQGFDTLSATPGTALFSYTQSGIKQNTADPYFTGYINNKNFNEIVITALSTSTPAGNSTYTAYPNAAFITVDQLQVGHSNASLGVPEAGAATLFLPAGLFGLIVAGFRRSRKSR